MAGKGSKPRVGANIRKYRKNYDAIKWGKTTFIELSGKGKRKDVN